VSEAVTVKENCVFQVQQVIGTAADTLERPERLHYYSKDIKARASAPKHPSI